MNTQEFIDEINRRKPSHLPLADREFLKLGEQILGSGPYYHDHVRQAISLLGIKYEFLGQLERRTGGSAIATDAKPKAAISQIIAIHNLDANQCHRIREGLIKTGLINFEGLISVNFSQFTHRTIESLPTDAFKDTDYCLEYSVFEEDKGEGKVRPLGVAPNPVIFIKDVEPTAGQLCFVSAGQRSPAIGRSVPLPSPLYKAFLNVNANSIESIMDFMNVYRVFLFTMQFDDMQLSNYIAGIDGSLKMGLVATEAQLKEFFHNEQNRMRYVLDAARQSKLGQVVFPPIFPVCEDAVVEWKEISGYFDPEFLQTQVPEGVTNALFEFKADLTSEATVRVRRYYGWLPYMWAELVDDIYTERQALVCERCGKVISRSKHGRTKMFCSRLENPACYKARKAEYVASSRRK